MMKRITVLALVALIAACSSTPDKEQQPAAVEERSPGAKPADKPAGTGAEATPLKPGAVGGNPLTDPASPLSKRSVFFDFDSDRIRDEFKPLVEAHAKFLRDRPYQKMLIQGNADDRGSREYNLALGQRRADALKRALVLLGANDKQIESASLGEEKPRCTEQTETCWAQNRRADMLYGFEL
jgi:peptidoglycan-associated lipoprotein